MSDGKITIRDNGPYVIDMPAEIVDTEGKSWSDDTWTRQGGFICAYLY